jgi:glucose-specific phosphotransferase system IIA component
MSIFSKGFGSLQKVGQSLMVPVSVLPAAGLLVALGRVLQGLESSLGKENFFVFVGKLFYSGGLAIFEQLPVVFAIGVAIGFTGGAGVAALAAAVGYFTLKNVLTLMTDARGLQLAIDTGVFGGIIIGLLSAQLYNKFHQTKLNPIFGFFAGKRLVPIITAASALIVGIALGYVWPPIQAGIKDFGVWVVGSDLGPAFYAAGKRLLIPVGLHHVYYPSFLYQFGEFTTLAGTVVKGDSARYFAGDPSAGRFMASEFPIMLFGLPAACLAMYLRAPKNRRAAIGGVMLSAALTSIITGITEPIEFAFIFVAPILFVFHVIAAFFSGVLTGMFDVHLGYTFSASLIDYAVGFFNQKNSGYLWILIGPAIAVLYFGVFYTAIGLLNLKTPGREAPGSEEGEEENISSNGAAANSAGTTSKGHRRWIDAAPEILKALGGASNLIELDACITRLRIQVKEGSKVLVPRLRELGAVGALNAGGGSFQIIFGPESDQIKDILKGLIASTHAVEIGSTKIIIQSPVLGKLISLDQVPDEVFSKKMMGEGFAVIPSEGLVRSPIDGEVSQIFKTGHAVGLTASNGLELLIHVGLDTVKMQGRGFEALVRNGQKVKVGDSLIRFDIDIISKEAKSIITPVVVTNTDSFKSVRPDLTNRSISIEI